MKRKEDYFKLLTKTREKYMQNKSIKSELDELISDYCYIHKEDEKN